MHYDSSDEEHRRVMEYLVSEGAAIFDGLDEDGEPIYKFDMELLEEVMPELHQALVNDIDNILVDLYLKGLIEVSYDEDLNAQMTLSEEAKEMLMEAGFDMDDSGEEDF